MCLHMYAYMLYLNVHLIIKIAVERVNQEKLLVEFAGYITLAGNQQAQP